MSIRILNLCNILATQTLNINQIGINWRVSQSTTTGLSLYDEDYLENAIQATMKFCIILSLQDV